MQRTKQKAFEKKTRKGTMKMSERLSNNVLIGQKPAMNYVLACITLLHGGANEINVKARGRAISHAVDVVEILRRKFLPDVKIKGIEIGTQQLPAREGEEGRGPMNVSTMEITLTK